MTRDEFVSRSVEIHGNKYDYSLVDYHTSDKHVIIICSKHRRFHQTPNAHLAGKGCARCNESTGEKAIARFLTESKIEFIPQHVIEPRLHPFKFDFYIPSKNLLVEFHGAQHFRAVEFFGGEKELRKTQARDWEKIVLAEEKGFEFLMIKYDESDKIPHILKKALSII